MAKRKGNQHDRWTTQAVRTIGNVSGRPVRTGSGTIELAAPAPRFFAGRTAPQPAVSPGPDPFAKSYSNTLGNRLDSGVAAALFVYLKGIFKRSGAFFLGR